MFCPKCGTQNLETASFCRRCGANIGVVSQALTGNLSAPPDAVGRRRNKLGTPSLESSVVKMFTGVAFVIVALCVMMFAPAGRIWWFWLLIPAITSLGKGIAEFMRWRHEQSGRALTGNVNATTNALPPRGTGELPPLRSTPIQTPTPVVQPPSVTEATTRHLDAKTPVESLFEKEK
jgi:hypothetical protein